MKDQPVGIEPPEIPPPDVPPVDRPPVGQSPYDYRPPARRRRGGGMVWAAILIGAGVILLLNNTGLLGWGVWEWIVRLWPVLLIAIGVSVIFGRRSLVGAGLAAALVLGTMAMAAGLYAANYSPGGGGPVSTHQISQPLKEATQATVRISPAVGVVNINALPASSSNLIDGSVTLGNGQNVSEDYSGGNGSVNYRLSVNGSDPGAWFSGWWGNWGRDWTWKLSLNRDVPTNLRIDAGVGKSDIDLSEMNVTNLRLDSGVGETTVTIPAKGKVAAEIHGGVGKITVRIPSGMAAQVRINRGVGGVSVSGLQGSGDVYTSTGYGTSANQADMNVSGGVGQIVVEEYGR